MMKKLTFDRLVVEPTRRCNANPLCKHCCRGDPQPIDLANEDVDALLGQVEQIYCLEIVGGEPFCNVAALDHVLSELKRRDIHLWSVTVVSNGIADKELIKRVMTDYANYITRCRTLDGIETKQAPSLLFISKDAYHPCSDIVDAKVNELKEELRGVANIYRNKVGDTTAASGRALKFLDADKLFDVSDSRRAVRQIAIHTKTEKPMCKMYRCFPLRREDQVIVCCPLYLSARGNLVHFDVASISEYETCDQPYNIICAASDPDIFGAIQRFNAGKDKLDCFNYDLRTVANMNEKQTAEYQKHIEHKLKHPDAFTPTAAPEDESVFPIATSLTPMEFRALNTPYILEPQARERIINNVRDRIRAWNGTSANDYTTKDFASAFQNEFIASTDIAKRAGLDRLIASDVERMIEQRNMQATQKRIDAVKAKVDADMAAIRAIWQRKE